jgi:hypothetical protein
MVKSLLTILAVALALESGACSCIYQSLLYKFSGRDVIFEGVSLGSRIVEATDGSETKVREIKVLVGRVYKGVITNERVIVRTRMTNCASSLPIGGRYLIFASGPDLETASTTPFVHTSMCSGNHFYPFWRFGLRKNVRRLMRGEELPIDSRWRKSPSW